MDKAAQLLAAEQHCTARGAKLTAVRRQVFELALNYPGVVKAYQILGDLQRERGVAAPPTVYRALDFLVEQGLLHRVEALNGFILCRHLDCEHDGLILVCSKCGKVEELDGTAVFGNLHAAAAAAGFAMEQHNLVLTGQCQECHAA